MKYINKPIHILVEFSPGSEPRPVCFQYMGQRIKVDAILDKRSERRAFCCCLIYKCSNGEQVFELRWDREHDRWYIDKI